ncbi:MAG: excinuclease ABC subunit UvrC [Thermodesulfobacteriota bacterium]
MKHPPPDPPKEESTSLYQKLAQVPKTPGVYLMKNRQGQIIYVGKAANLKSRLSSYFSHSAHMDAKTGVLVKHIADFETVLTASENEALVLESNLIKRHRPRYNVILKDDKRYPSLRIDPRKPFPNLTVVRKIKKDGALYFGPYPSAGSVRQTMKLIHRYFKLRQCKHADVKPRQRPCLNYQINACMAPCSKEVDPDEYREIVNEVRMFLSGRTSDLVRKIKADMAAAAGRQDFETAAQLRDKMYAIEKTMEKQVAVSTDFVDRDVVAVARAETLAVIMLLKVRNGFLQGMRDYSVHDLLADNAEMIAAFIGQYYETADAVPTEVLTGVEIAESELYGKWLSGLKGKKVVIRHPKRGDKVRLLEMARQNAAERLKALTEQADADARLLEGLQQRLGMENPPRRIECIDNSGISGQDLVSGLVVFQDARPDKSAYRKYRIKTVSEQDDYAAMAEVLGRRYGRKDAEAFPDLLMVDGGKGQLNIATTVLQQLGIEGCFSVIGIAKKDEDKGEPDDKIYLPGRANPVNFTRHREQLYLLQRIRDEAHRYAISFHRKRRGSRSLTSVLDEISGIGKMRKATLLQHFQDINGIRAASVAQISALPGMNRTIAENLKQQLSDNDEKTNPPE